MALTSENYKVIITDSAQEDIDQYIDTIMYTYDAPRTAKRHYDDLYAEFRKIERNPMINSVRYNLSLMKYGFNVRRANYKKMAILYTVNNDIVYIHRVVAGSMITGV